MEQTIQTAHGSFAKGVLGRTGLSVGRLGLAASYGAPPAAFEEAFERGCNYFYIGSGRRRANMKTAIRNICENGHREHLVVAVQTYARFGLLTETLFRRNLRSMGLAHADILMLGWHNRRPAQRLMDMALRLKQNGLCRFIGMSGHSRGLFVQLTKEGVFDLFHVRYNAAHRGAETETFPFLKGDSRPGVVSYTATRWGHLLKSEKMPEGEPPLRASDCYRFAMSHPAVDVCLCGPSNMEQMREALTALDLGPLSEAEMERARRVGDHVHRHGGGFF
ncbi:aldo-keto reductase family protein [Desulfosudis oleivorans]|uniref:Oxidoreductase of the aldo/keto reductase family-like protein n=1 Tax=Desulfosudis oleivorans (strain DSM 6200 / JCM 39069 / Hxd3) TaxID=96561 RepID=A8ZT44_DESOH|nr:aldo/keto reductase [Desulfosudis oleivorans]ABW66208.1 oxidoreductase of the aldo/keto reductase family-like protein [Desulfosudis oleivorans Hxd3]